MRRHAQISKTISFLFFIVFILASCKREWLDAKPDKKLVIPTSIKDYQALLDNNISGPAPTNANDCFLDEIGAGDFYVTDAVWAGRSPIERNAYIWAPDIFTEPDDNEWNYQYSAIFYANIALEGAEKINPTNNAEQLEVDQVKGSALFLRAYRHYAIAKIFCKEYDKNTAANDLGIPLRLQSDFNTPSIRASVQKTYEQILGDLKQSANLLPVSTPTTTLTKLRPTKTAAYAMLARVYLAMGTYDSAFAYANKTLGMHNTLMDYNLSPPLISGTFKIPIFNDEVIFHMRGTIYLIMGLSRLAGGLDLYNSYDINDARRDVFWRLSGGFLRFVGSYNGDGLPFTGLATDEIYLIRAECNARAGNKDAALVDLNTLMEKRWKNNGTWTPFTAISANEALQKILSERRKELCLRGTRWADLRRLNKDPQFAVTLSRTVNGTNYTLLPNSNLYVLPIPPNVIQLTGMEQNPR
jgi:tetratricopeptide (TPR) repeat protein